VIFCEGCSRRLKKVDEITDKLDLESVCRLTMETVFSLLVDVIVNQKYEIHLCDYYKKFEDFELEDEVKLAVIVATMVTMYIVLAEEEFEVGGIEYAG